MLVLVLVLVLLHTDSLSRTSVECWQKQPDSHFSSQIIPIRRRSRATSPGSQLPAGGPG